jgi:hypothetical protein
MCNITSGLRGEERIDTVGSQANSAMPVHTSEAAE